MALNTYNLKLNGVLDTVKAIRRNDEPFDVFICFVFNSGEINVGYSQVAVENYVAPYVSVQKVFSGDSFTSISMQVLVDLISDTLDDFCGANPFWQGWFFKYYPSYL